MNGLITALRTLTVLRVPGKDADDFADSLPYFPLAGVLVGAVSAGAAWLVVHYAGWNEAAAVAAIAVSFIMTGGLHLDGFSDVFDALGGRTKERRLEIMKDTHKGSFGVAAIVMLCLAKYVCIVKLLASGGFLWLVTAAVCARFVQVLMAITLPYARAEGGTAVSFVKGAKIHHFVIALALSVLIVSALSRFPGFAVLAGSVGAGLLIALWAKRMFGGVTGDLLGMSSETIETLVLFAGVIIAGGLS